MNTDQITRTWKQLIDKGKEKGRKLTDNDWQIVEGKRDQLVGRIQGYYKIAREKGERRIGDFRRAMRGSRERRMTADTRAGSPVTCVSN